MKIIKDVTVETEVEVQITAEDVTSALMAELTEWEEMEDVKHKHRRSLSLINSCANVLRAIPDDHIANMTAIQCKVVVDFLDEQMKRYQFPSVPETTQLAHESDV